MSSDLNRPIVAVDSQGNRFFDCDAVLLHRVELKVSTYTDQMRVELWEWRPGQEAAGHLVWQHHNRYRYKQHTAPHDGTRALLRSGEWLGKEGWPGIAL